MIVYPIPPPKKKKIPTLITSISSPISISVSTSCPVTTIDISQNDIFCSNQLFLSILFIYLCRIQFSCIFFFPIQESQVAKNIEFFSPICGMFSLIII